MHKLKNGLSLFIMLVLLSGVSSAQYLTNIKATSVSGTSEKITWTACCATQGLVKWGTSQTSLTSSSGWFDTTVQLNHSYTITTGLTAGTTYWYTVSSRTGATSAIATSSPRSFIPAATGRSVDLVWVKPTSGCSSGCTYNVLRGAVHSGTTYTCTTSEPYAQYATNADLTFTDSAVSVNNTYCYRVNAVNGGGPSPLSNVARAVVQ